MQGFRCVLFALFVVFLMSFPAHAQEPLRFAVCPDKSPKIILSSFGPFVARLSEKIGHPITLVTAPDKETFRERALAGEYDLLLANHPTYFNLQDQKGFLAIARGEPDFQGGVIVRAESGITEPLQLLDNKKIACITEQSYAGFLFLHALLVQNGLKTEPSPYSPMEKLDSVVYAVMNKNADAGIIRLDILDTPKFRPLKEQFRIIHTSTPIPQFPFVVSPALDPLLREQIGDALVAMAAEDPDTPLTLAPYNVHSIRRVTDADFQAFRQEYEKSRQIIKQAATKAAP